MLSIVADVIIILLGAVPLWLLGRENKLWWIRLSPPRSKCFAPPSASGRWPPELLQKLRSNGTDRFTEHMILFRYKGSRALDGSCIIKPITLVSPSATIVCAKQIISQQDSALEISHSRSFVKVKWDLLNPGWAFVVGILCEGCETSDRWRVQGLVKHISRIKKMSNQRMFRLFPLVVVLAIFPSVIVGNIVWQFFPSRA